MMVNWTEDKWNKFMSKVDTIVIEMIELVGDTDEEVLDFKDIIGMFTKRMNKKKEQTPHYVDYYMDKYYKSIKSEIKRIEHWHHIELSHMLDGWWR
tara:strand:+ start:457 stop:744 length:288 start_codon:yes stop_codon:yes gene_type:complete